MNKSSRSVMTFKNGIHPVYHGKELSESAETRVAPLLARYTVLLAQNAGKPPEVVVNAGDHVKKYQLIAKASGFVSANLHSPVSGTVKGLIDVPGPMGVPAKAVEIIPDGLAEEMEPLPALDWRTAEPKDRSKFSAMISRSFSSLTFPVPKLSTITLTGSATPMA